MGETDIEPWEIHRDDPKGRSHPIRAVAKHLSKQRVGMILGPLLFLVTVALPEPQSMVDAAAVVGCEVGRAPQIALGTLLWVLVWWVSECVPLGIAALLPPLVFSMTQILEWKNALTAFTDPIIWIFMAGFVLAAAFRKWDLDRRIAIRLGLMYKGKNPMVAALFVASLPVFILTLTGSITASTAVVFPFLIAYLSMAGVKPGSRYSEACMLVLAQAATAGAMLLLISTPPNLIAKSTAFELPAEWSVDITFLDWLIVGAPHAIIGLLITWFVVFKMLKPEEKTVAADRSKMVAVSKQLGRFSQGEKAVAGLLALAVTLWVLPSAVKVAAGYMPSLTGLSQDLSRIMPEAMPAVLVILLAGLIRVRGEPLLKWEELAKGIDWNVVFLFGGGIALGAGLKMSGFADWLAMGVSSSLGANSSAWMIFAVACFLGFLLTYAASNTAAALITCPIAASLAFGAGVHPVPPIIGAALACSISSAIPSTTPPMAIVYSSGYVKIWNMFKVGVVSDTLRLGVLILIGPFLCDLII
jgi:sodium-dependent dicarboxylate transporter 2/3/5